MKLSLILSCEEINTRLQVCGFIAFIRKHIYLPISRMKFWKLFPSTDHDYSFLSLILSSFILPAEPSGEFKDENRMTRLNSHASQYP